MCRGLPHLEVFDKDGGEGVLSERLGLVKIVEEDEGGEDLVLPAAEEVGLSEELDEREPDLEGVRAAEKGMVAN